MDDCVCLFSKKHDMFLKFWIRLVFVHFIAFSVVFCVFLLFLMN